MRRYCRWGTVSSLCFFNHRQQGTQVPKASEHSPVVTGPEYNQPKADWLVHAFSRQGHRIALINPIQTELPQIPELTPEFYRFSSKSATININPYWPDELLTELAKKKTEDSTVSIAELISALHATYGGPLSVECHHVPAESKAILTRLFREYDTHVLFPPLADHVLSLTARSVQFEQLLAKQFPTTKRFGSEGSETLVVLMESILRAAATLGEVESAVVGMAHRGRLNVLHNALGMPLGEILQHFTSKMKRDASPELHGDVMYHLPYRGEVSYEGMGSKGSKKQLKVHCLPNPSHLETVGPILMGAVKAEQWHRAYSQKGLGATEAEINKAKQQVLGIVIHGDASLNAQGICYESFGLQELDLYNTGGLIRVIVNNHIGFTTNPHESRSTPHASDLARHTRSPIIHVNADHPLQVARAGVLAAEYRRLTGKTIVIDLQCFRRNGHNEIDEPRFTQPHLYKKIDQHPGVLAKWAEQDGLVVTNLSQMTEKVEAEDANAKAEVTRAYKEWTESPDYIPRTVPKDDGSDTALQLLRTGITLFPAPTTGVPLANLRNLTSTLVHSTSSLTADKDGFHPTVLGIIGKRNSMYTEEKELDWGAVEQLAYASLLADGFSVRLTGEDIERGTFSHRHFKLHSTTAEPVVPLTFLARELALTNTFQMRNSMLSECATSAFEFGYACERQADTIVTWEAQFGDFANVGQNSWDTLVCGSEAKWATPTAMVVSLPHGYGGQGPEHSSGRVERYLELSYAAGDDAGSLTVPTNLITDPSVPPQDATEARIRSCNWQVAFPSEPSQLFHLLRRQLHRNYRKPLIVFVSKANLRGVTSPLDEMAEETRFQAVRPDPSEPLKASDPVHRLLLCTGGIYQELDATRCANRSSPKPGMALLRLEQLSPFPWEEVIQLLEPYFCQQQTLQKPLELVWVQQEPRNMGAWPFVRSKLSAVARYLTEKHQTLNVSTEDISFVGRDGAASPSTGSAATHAAEAQGILDKALRD